MINMLILHKIAINLNFILSVFEGRVFSLIHPFCQQSCCLRALLQHYKCYQIVLIPSYSFNILDINFQSGTKFIHSILIDNSLFFRVYKFISFRSSSEYWCHWSQADRRQWETSGWAGMRIVNYLFSEFSVKGMQYLRGPIAGWIVSYMGWQYLKGPIAK